MSAQLKQNQEVFLVYDFEKDLYARKNENSYKKLDWVDADRATFWTSKGALKNSFNDGVLRHLKNSKSIIVETWAVMLSIQHGETLLKFMEKKKK